MDRRVSVAVQVNAKVEKALLCLGVLGTHWAYPVTLNIDTLWQQEEKGISSLPKHRVN